MKQDENLPCEMQQAYPRPELEPFLLKNCCLCLKQMEPCAEITAKMYFGISASLIFVSLSVGHVTLMIYLSLAPTYQILSVL